MRWGSTPYVVSRGDVSKHLLWGGVLRRRVTGALPLGGLPNWGIIVGIGNIVDTVVDSAYGLMLRSSSGRWVPLGLLLLADTRCVLRMWARRVGGYVRGVRCEIFGQLCGCWGLGYCIPRSTCGHRVPWVSLVLLLLHLLVTRLATCVSRYLLAVRNPSLRRRPS